MSKTRKGGNAAASGKTQSATSQNDTVHAHALDATATDEVLTADGKSLAQVFGAEISEDDDFGETVLQALERIDGQLLFQMELAEDDCRHVAAISLGSGDERQFALVILPPEGGHMRVEPATNSDNPLAGIARSFAGVIDAYRAAA